MNTGNTTQLVTVNIAARRLRVPTKWLRDEAEAGRVPCLRAGRRVLMSLPAVEAALLERAERTVAHE